MTNNVNSTVSTYGMASYNTQQVLNMQKQLQLLEQQLTSGQVSSDYAGIASSAGNLLNYQNKTNQLSTFQSANTMVNLRLTSMTQAVSSIQDTMTNFRDQLAAYGTNSTPTANDIQQLQDSAFTALKAMESYLNTDVNGQYLFGGTQTSVPPLAVNAQILSDFQQQYNGSTSSFGTSSAADLSQFSANVSSTGNLTFDAAKNTITAGSKGQFANLPVGSVIAVTNSNGSDGRYTVAANDGTTLTLGPAFTSEGSSTSPIAITTTDATGKQKNTNAYYTAPDTITTTNAGDFANLTVGSTINLNGGSQYANNDGAFVVASNNGTTLTIKRATLPTPPAANTNLTSGSDTTATVSSGGASLGATNVTFAAPNQITLTPASATTGLAVNSVISVNSPGTMGNNGSYIVTGIAGGVLTVQSADTNSLITENGATGTINSNGTNLTTGSLNFDGPDGLVQASTTGAFSSLLPGQNITVSGTSMNNGVYQVLGTYNTAVQSETAPTAATLSGGGNTITNATSGTLTFNAAATPPTVSAANAGAFANISVGQVVNVANTSSNNGQFVVVGIDPTNHQSLQLAPAGTIAKVARSTTIATTSLFQGNNSAISQTIDQNQNYVTATSAMDPAFEKAIRAMAMIAQGAAGTTGSLANNSQRIPQALYLMNDALNHTAIGAPPFNKESTRSINDVEFTLSVQAKTLNDLNTTQTTIINQMQSASSAITTADPNEVIMKLLSQQNALQASYQAISRTQTMSLLDYLK